MKTVNERSLTWLMWPVDKERRGWEISQLWGRVDSEDERENAPPPLNLMAAWRAICFLMSWACEAAWMSSWACARGVGAGELQ